MVKDEKLISRLGKPCYTCDDTGVATPEAREQVLDRTSQIFPPELLNLNRLDSGSYLANSTRIHPPSSFSALKTSHIVLDVDSATNELLACQCYSELHGACAIACVVHTNVLFPLAQDLLRMTIREGDLVKAWVSEDDTNLVIEPITWVRRKNQVEDTSSSRVDLEFAINPGSWDT